MKEKYRNLLQVSVSNNAHIYTLDDPLNPAEIAQLESIDKLMSSSKLFNTGFMPCYKFYNSKQNQNETKEIIQNAECSFQYKRKLTWSRTTVKIASTVNSANICFGYTYSDLKTIKSLFDIIKQ